MEIKVGLYVYSCILNFKRIGPQGNEIFPYREAAVEVWRPAGGK